MRVLISVDMEGVAGIATPAQCRPGHPEYASARARMTAEANAAIEGAFDGGATAVVVNDSHGANAACNLLGEELDRRADYVVGSPKPLVMMQELTADTAVSLFVGYHAGAGDPTGVLSHTFGDFGAVSLNGHEVTEAEVNALIAARAGVPVGLVTGDDVICAIAEKAFPGVVTVPVKTAIGRTAARSMHPAAARRAIRDGARRALAAAGSHELEPVRVPEELIVEVELLASGAAEVAALVPGTERIGARLLRRRAADPREVLRLIMIWGILASGFSPPQSPRA